MEHIIPGYCSTIVYVWSCDLSGILFKAATILRLLGNETIQFNTRGKKSEPGLRKQLNVEVKSTTKFNFFSLNILIYLYLLLI